MSAKSPACDVSISNIITKKDKHQHKVQESNNHLKDMCTNKNIKLIDHSKNIKHKHLNKSKLHLPKRGTNILLIARYKKYQIYINRNALYVALRERLLVVVILLDIHLIAKNYALKLTI